MEIAQNKHIDYLIKHAIHQNPLSSLPQLKNKQLRISTLNIHIKEQSQYPSYLYDYTMALGKKNKRKEKFMKNVNQGSFQHVLKSTSIIYPKPHPKMFMKSLAVFEKKIKFF